VEDIAHNVAKHAAAAQAPSATEQGVSVDERKRAEAEKHRRVTLKLARYGFDEFCDEMRTMGLRVDVDTGPDRLAVEIRDDNNEVLATAMMSRYAHAALDRAARQIRAQLEVAGEIGPWEDDD
jgi:hypothetical protein